MASNIPENAANNLGAVFADHFGSEKDTPSDWKMLATTTITQILVKPHFMNAWNTEIEVEQLRQLSRKIEETSRVFSALNGQISQALADEFKSQYEGIVSGSKVQRGVEADLHFQLLSLSHILPDAITEIEKRITNREIQPAKEINYRANSHVKWQRVVSADCARRLWASYKHETVNSIPTIKGSTEPASEFGLFLKEFLDAIGIKGNPSAVMESWRNEHQVT